MVMMCGKLMFAFVLKQFSARLQKFVFLYQSSNEILMVDIANESPSALSNQTLTVQLDSNREIKIFKTACYNISLCTSNGFFFDLNLFFSHFFHTNNNLQRTKHVTTTRAE